MGALGVSWLQNESVANDINVAGQIIGWANDDTKNQFAVIFDKTGHGNNVKLNALIDPLSGWNLVKATCINDKGWISGIGINPEGKESPFLLVPVPEPISGLLLLGGLILRRKVSS
jgi:hypothetical protein